MGGRDVYVLEDVADLHSRLGLPADEHYCHSVTLQADESNVGDVYILPGNMVLHAGGTVEIITPSLRNVFVRGTYNDVLHVSWEG